MADCAAVMPGAGEVAWPPGFELFRHLPSGTNADTQVLVVIHGISRNAEEHLNTFKTVAGETCAIIAPLFRAETFPHFQHLGIGRPELRADLMLESALARLARQSGLDLRRFHLFGFSGGAQFAHRFAMLRPDLISSLHLASAGYYTFFDRAAPWPRGCGRDPVGRMILGNAGWFLRLPIHVYVGTEDTRRDEALRKGDRVDRQQGRTRRERAGRWCAHLRDLGASACAPVTVLPRCGHSFHDACDPSRGDLARRVIASVTGA